MKNPDVLIIQGPIDPPLARLDDDIVEGHVLEGMAYNRIEGRVSFPATGMPFVNIAVERDGGVVKLSYPNHRVMHVEWANR